MTVKKIASVLMAVCLTACIFTGCSQAKKEASQTMTDYLNHIAASEYSEAYAMLSDFDRGNISEDDFIAWRELAAQIVTIQSFTIDSKLDTFKNYKYLGTEFGDVYGLKVNSKQDVHIPDVELANYDQDTFRIMVQKQKDEYKVLLLLTNLNETIAVYQAYIDKIK